VDLIKESCVKMTLLLATNLERRTEAVSSRGLRGAVNTEATRTGPVNIRAVRTDPVSTEVKSTGAARTGPVSTASISPMTSTAPSTTVIERAAGSLSWPP
jgi:hypothetical protein